MTERRVFDGAHLRAALVGPGPAEARGLMVTFDFRKAGKSDFGPALASSNFARAGYAQLSVRTKLNDWFINDDTTAFEAALPGIVAGYRQVRALGYSMGGYGALRFSKALGLSRLVAVAPQVSIHPAQASFDARFRAEARGFDPGLGALDGRVAQGLGGLVIYDPFVRPDRLHARRLGAMLPGLSFARLGFGGHPPVRVLGGARRSGLVMRAASHDADLGPAIIGAHRAARQADAGYWSRLARRARATRPALAAHAAAQADRLAAMAAQSRVDEGPESP